MPQIGCLVGFQQAAKKNFDAAFANLAESARESWRGRPARKVIPMDIKHITSGAPVSEEEKLQALPTKPRRPERTTISHPARA